MEKNPLTLATHVSHRPTWLAILVVSVFVTTLLFFLGLNEKTCSLQTSLLLHVADDQARTKSDDHDRCRGRYVYVQNPPSQFSEDLVNRCETTFTTGPDRDICPYLDNLGLGRRVKGDGRGVLTRGSWYRTNLYSLSVIFHNRMRNYECLTNDSSLADAIYVPYYAGLDASRNLWSRNLSLRDESAAEFAKWVGETPEWKRMWGRDHFIVTGRTAWDFRRELDGEKAWGTRLRLLPHSHNMSMLSVESSLWSNDYAIPYPTCFHPSSDTQISQWQQRMRTRKRRYLFSFVGAPRAKQPETLRSKVIEECQSSSGLCRLLGCGTRSNGAVVDCNDPVRVMRLLQDSVFCLQPRGDSFTRKSFFDSIVAGCIPVMFHPGSAYLQYQWYLPKDHNNYSVYIPVETEEDWRPGIVKETLSKISRVRVQALREEVIRLIPRIVYGHPESRLSSYDDAFDVALNGILERIARVRRRIEDGEDPSVGFAERDYSKYDLFRYNHLRD